MLYRRFGRYCYVLDAKKAVNLRTLPTAKSYISPQPKQHFLQRPQHPLLRCYASSSKCTTSTPGASDTPLVTVTKTDSDVTLNNEEPTTSATRFPPPRPLIGDERANAIKTLNEASNGSPFQWEDDPSGRNAIVKVYYFVNFLQAFEFMKHIAGIAEEMNHHPEWKNIYNIVDVTLSTHDCHGVSYLDIQLAQQMDSYANSLLPQRDNTTTENSTS